jgi:ribonuclease inhibitor
MPVKRCVLHDIRTQPQFYDQLQRQLALPAHFGRNLDALWDALSNDVAGPFEIVWQGAQQSRASLGADFDKLLAVFHDLAAERDDFTLTLE